MDKAREHRPPPDTFKEIPEDTREWLATITKEDIARFRKWNGFIVWAETSGRYAKVLVGSLLAVFGVAVAIRSGIEAWGWLFKGGRP